MKIFTLPIPSTISENKFNQLNCLVSEHKKERIAKFIHKDDKYRTLLGDILTRYYLITTFNWHNNDIMFTYNRFNKPLLKNTDHININISHSGKWVVLATDSQPIGIDIELIHPLDLSVIDITLSEKEKKNFRALPEQNKLALFYEIWTMKESFIKAIGKGLSRELRDITVYSNPSHNETTIQEENCTYYIHKIDIDPHYKMALCSLRNEYPPPLSHLSFDELFTFFNTLANNEDNE